jgi:hypothetical protein
LVFGAKGQWNRWFWLRLTILPIEKPCILNFFFLTFTSSWFAMDWLIECGLAVTFEWSVRIWLDLDYYLRNTF